MSHDFEPTEAEKEMLSHIKDIEVNRKQSELGNIISGAILDGQNQIHDLYKEKATAQEVEYRMRRSYTYWMNKLHQELQKALAEKDKECGQAMKDFMAMCHTAADVKIQNAINEERERFVKIVDDIGYNMAELYESTVEEIVKAITHSELDQPK